MAHSRSGRDVMGPFIGSKIKDKQRDKWLAMLASYLHHTEEVVALSRSSLMHPVADGLAVTTARVVTFLSVTLANGKVVREAYADEIAGTELEKRPTGRNCLVVRWHDGEAANFGDIPRADAQEILDATRRLIATGIDGEIKTSLATERGERASNEEAWRGVQVIGTQPSLKAWQCIKDHSGPNELPWFVVGGDLAGGAFVAFDDRCMIVKVGAVTSLIAGSFGGGRVTSFPFSQVTGIEYNSGMINGVLEVLTPSYQGTANKDYWRGTHRSRNADSHDPWTLSNALPMNKTIYRQALPLINEMRAKITESKHGKVPRPESNQAGSEKSLGDELKILTELRAAGALDEAEFHAAKRAAIARYS